MFELGHSKRSRDEETLKIAGQLPILSGLVEGLGAKRVT